MFCKKCGNQVQKGAAFCGNCGSKVEKGTSLSNSKTKKLCMIIGAVIVCIVALVVLSKVTSVVTALYLD